MSHAQSYDRHDAIAPETGIDTTSMDAYGRNKHDSPPKGSLEGETTARIVEEDPENDAVFGVRNDKGPNYRAVGWMGAIVLMSKSNIGLGVLSIPFVLQSVGMVTGCLLIFFVGIIITWSDWVVGTFKLNHRDVYGLPDVGRILFGRIGEEVLTVVFCIYTVFVSASGLVGISTAFNAVSTHGTCTAVFIAVAAIIGWLCQSIRTLGKITWLGWIGIVSILAAIFTMTISVIIQDRPADAPQTGPWEKDLEIVGHPSFAVAMSAVNSVIFSLSATSTFFGIIAEMKDPRRYNRSLAVAQSFVICLYILIGVIVYYFCGQFVAYPALGSAGVTMKKVCYGLAIPGLCVTLCIYSHLPAKVIFLRLMKNSPHLNANNWQHWSIWLSCTASVMFSAYIIASAIPIFGSLISLIGAVFCPMICMIPFSLMWLHDNWFGKSYRPTHVKLHAAWAWLVLILGVFCTIAGTYGSIVEIIQNYTGGQRPWACIDNSNSVASG